MAITSLNATLNVSLTINAQKVDPGLDPTKKDVNVTKRFSFTTGVGALGCNEAVVMTRTLAAGAAETLDLSAALTNLVRDANITLARIKVLFIWLLGLDETVGDSATGSQVTGTACSGIVIGDAAGAEWPPATGGPGSTIGVSNKGVAVFARGDATGWPVTSGSADQLKVTNSDGAVEARYMIAFLGADA